MRKKWIFIISAVLLIIILSMVLWKQYQYVYWARQVNAGGLQLFMKQEEVIALFGEEDAEDPYCMGCGPDMNYEKLGIFARISDTEQYVKEIAVTNPAYDILGIHPEQALSQAERSIKKKGFKFYKQIDSGPLVDNNYSLRIYHNKKLTIRLAINERERVERAEIYYEVKADDEVVY